MKANKVWHGLNRGMPQDLILDKPCNTKGNFQRAFMQEKNEIIMQAVHIWAKPEQSWQISAKSYELLRKWTGKGKENDQAKATSSTEGRLLNREGSLAKGPAIPIGLCMCSTEIHCLAKQWLFRHRNNGCLLGLPSNRENLYYGLFWKYRTEGI